MLEIKDAAVLMEGFPPGYILLVLIIGFIMILFSPISLISPDWISNPFLSSGVALTPTEVLSRFGIITVSAFVLGIPLSLLENFLTRDEGANHKLKSYFFKNTTQKTPVKDSELPLHKFLVWLKKTGYLQYHNYLVLKNAIVNGLIVGSEIAATLNIICLPILIIFGINIDYLRALIGLVCSSLILGLSLAFNKIYWNKTITRHVKKMWQEFQRDNKQPTPIAFEC